MKKLIVFIESILPEFLVILLKQVHRALLSNTFLEYKNIYIYAKSLYSNVNTECPICSWNGVFFDYINRYDARCPRCGSLERHRMQFLVISKLHLNKSTSTGSCLHIAPEPFIKPYLKKQWFNKYVSTDLFMKDVDFRSDLRKLPVRNEYFDFIYCSHVLEHIKDDILAIKEIYRVLSVDGTAFLAVPVLYDQTIEYNRPNLKEFGHVRGIGPDYFDKFKVVGFHIEIISSDDLQSDKNRTRYYFFKTSGYKNDQPDYVAVCTKK